MFLDSYAKSIDKYRPLSRAEEKTATKEELITANLKFVMKIAHEYKHMHNLDELIQEGNVGLIHAASRFDPSENIKFITFAVHYIRKYMREAITQKVYSLKGSHYKKDFQMISLSEPINHDTSNTVEDIMLSKVDNKTLKNMLNADNYDRLYDILSCLTTLERTIIVLRYGLFNMKEHTLSEIANITGYTIPGVRQIEKRTEKALKKNFK